MIKTSFSVDKSTYRKLGILNTNVVRNVKYGSLKLCNDVKHIYNVFVVSLRIENKLDISIS